MGNGLNWGNITEKVIAGHSPKMLKMRMDKRNGLPVLIKGTKRFLGR